MIDIDGGVLHILKTLHLIYVLESRHETMRHKLVLPAVFVHDGNLPVQEIGNHLAPPTLPFVLIGRAGHPVACVKFLPGTDIHAPIVQSPQAVQAVEIVVELIFHVVAETDKVVMIIDTPRFAFVVHLIADNRRIVCITLHHLTDDPLAIEAVGRIVDIHVLADAVIPFATVNGFGEHFRMTFSHPGGNGIGGRAQYHLNTGSLKLADDAVHPPEVENTFSRLEQSPRRLADTDDIQAALFHQADIFV